MQITREFLQGEIGKMETQRARAHDVAVASQAAIDVMQGLIQRLEAEDLTFSDLGLSDPEPVKDIDDAPNTANNL